MGHSRSSHLHVLDAPLVGELLHRLLVGNAGKALLLKPVGPAKGHPVTGAAGQELF